MGLIKLGSWNRGWGRPERPGWVSLSLVMYVFMCLRAFMDYLYQLGASGAVGGADG